MKCVSITKNCGEIAVLHLLAARDAGPPSEIMQKYACVKHPYIKAPRVNPFLRKSASVCNGICAQSCSVQNHLCVIVFACVCVKVFLVPSLCESISV